MKLIKLTMLAAIAAVAAMAFIGASTASADPFSGVCFVNPTNLPARLGCVSRPKHPLLGRMLTLVGPGAFKAGFEIKCNKGMGISNEVQSQQEGAFKATLEELNFEECSGGCKAVKVITPQPVEAVMESAEAAFRLKSANAKVEFFECTFGVKCKFEGTLDLPIHMDSEAKEGEPEGDYVDPEGTEFKRIEGPEFCGTIGKWESGRTRLDWLLDNAPTDTIHQHVRIVLLAELVITS
jgi:hypothetical protein